MFLLIMLMILFDSCSDVSSNNADDFRDPDADDDPATVNDSNDDSVD